MEALESNFMCRQAIRIIYMEIDVNHQSHGELRVALMIASRPVDSKTSCPHSSLYRIYKKGLPACVLQFQPFMDIRTSISTI